MAQMAFKPKKAAHSLVQSTSAELIAAVQRGLPFREIEILQDTLREPLSSLAARLGMALSTLHRRKIAGHLSGRESEKLVRFARIIRQATDTFGHPDDARLWLSTAQTGLGGAIPLDYASTELGAREVENLLGRIEHGVYA